MKKFLIIAFTTFSFNSCIKPCIEAKGLFSTGMTITFFQIGNNEYFYPEDEWLSPYKKDSLKVTDSDGFDLRIASSLNQSPTNRLKRFYVVGIAPVFDVQLDRNAFQVERTKYLYINYDYKTSDTLKLIFKAKKTKCADVYEYMKIYHRNLLIHSVENTASGLVFTLNH
jgi:hypothetical protein